MSSTFSLLRRLAEISELNRLDHLRAFASTFQLALPHPIDQDSNIDKASVTFLSDLAVRSNLPLPEFVRHVRGQTDDDNRPNKALYEVPVKSTCSSPDTFTRWNSIVREGVRPRWNHLKPPAQRHRPLNHKSSSQHANAVQQHIRKGQREGRYLVLDERVLALWPELFISPIGVVAKGDDDTRMINDYSYPRGASVNEFTNRDNFPSIAYNPPRDIARRIHSLRSAHPNEEVLLMLGDVSGAFRHVPVHEDDVHMFVFIFDGYVVIDLSCGFGWCGSPAFYSLAGAVINDLYECADVGDDGDLSLGHLHGNVWCDDHTCVEINRGQRCKTANIALRHAMATVLGPAAINDKKFTAWGANNKALGLVWNTADGTVSIPDEKLEKANLQVMSLLTSRRATKSELNKLLGILRHVATCFPPARAFYQRLHVAAIYTPPFGSQTLDLDAIEDLRWFQAVIRNKGRFNCIPVAHFARATTPSVHVYMDASGSGLCVLEPQRREFIRLQYPPHELKMIRSGSYENSINVRELQSAVLAALHWGPHWKETATGCTKYVCFHIDNTSAVVWASKRLSRHPTVQLYNRLLSLTEFEHQLAFTAEHIPGKLNTMADAGRSSTSFRQSLKRLGSTLCGAALARTTTSKYSAHWTQWSDFSRFMRWSPRLKKCDRSSSNKLAYFAIYLWKYGWNTSGSGNQYPTIQSKLSSVFWYHRRFFDLDLSRSPLLKVLLQGIKRLSDPTKKKLPVTPAFLRILRRSLRLNRPRDRLLWGSVLLAYFFLLRRSEYLVTENRRHFYCLKTQDAFFADARGNPVSPDVATAVTIGLSGAKNDQYGRGAWRTMHQSGDRSLCPVRALKHLFQARQELGVTNHTHLCVDLTAKAVSNALKKTASRAGVDPSNYSTHSLRSGGATALLSGKADSLSIKILGRWVSRCFEEYPLQAAASTSDLSRRMVFP